MKIKKVIGINAFCEDEMMDKVVELFRDALGAKIGHDQPWLEQYGFKAKGAWLGTEAPFRVEIAESINDELVTGKQIKRLAPTFAILHIAVEDIDEAIAELRAKGIKVSDKLKIEDPGFEGGGFYECMIHPKSAYGLIIELIEYTKAPPDGEW